MQLRRQSAKQQPLPSQARKANERQDISEEFVMEDDHFGSGTLQYREQMTLRIREQGGLLLYYQRQQRHVSCVGEVWMGRVDFQV